VAHIATDCMAEAAANIRYAQPTQKHSNENAVQYDTIRKFKVD